MLSHLLVDGLTWIWRIRHGKAHPFQVADVNGSLLWSPHALHRPLYCDCSVFFRLLSWLSSLQVGSGCPVGAAHRGYSAYYPGILRLLSSYILSTPALLAVWLPSAVPLLI